MTTVTTTNTTDRVPESQLGALEPLGARIGVDLRFFLGVAHSRDRDTYMAWISTVEFNDAYWTRVEFPRQPTVHYAGNLDTQEAAYRRGAELKTMMESTHAR